MIRDPGRVVSEDQQLGMLMVVVGLVDGRQMYRPSQTPRLTLSSGQIM